MKEHLRRLSPTEIHVPRSHSHIGEVNTPALKALEASKRRYALPASLFCHHAVSTPETTLLPFNKNLCEMRESFHQQEHVGREFAERHGIAVHAALSLVNSSPQELKRDHTCSS